jgi:hypothetical protein
MLVLRLAALPLTAAALAFGVWVAGGWITDDFRVSMALTAGWFLVAGIGCLLATRRVRWLRVPVVLGYVVAAGAIGAYLGATTLRDRVVDEKIVRAAALVRAPFRSHEHATAGTATVVRLADGRRFVTLTGFSTSPGPDLRVRLAPGDTADGGAPGTLDLGALKGNRGNQQYEIPPGVRVSGRTLVIWCRAFSAAFGSALLA